MLSLSSIGKMRLREGEDNYRGSTNDFVVAACRRSVVGDRLSQNVKKTYRIIWSAGVGFMEKRVSNVRQRTGGGTLICGKSSAILHFRSKLYDNIQPGLGSGQERVKVNTRPG